jgi:hypothetical protein
MDVVQELRALPVGLHLKAFREKAREFLAEPADVTLWEMIS